MANPIAASRRRLTLFDSVCIIVGIIVGAGFYESSSVVAGLTGSAGELLGVWALGGVISLIGAVCYAELAAADPRDGGEYVFLSRAFGTPMGFLFAWVGFWVVRPGNIGAMALVFGKYAALVLPLQAAVPRHDLVYAIASIVLLSVIHAAGVRPGKWVQNLLTSAKGIGLLTVIIVGFSFIAPDRVVDWKQVDGPTRPTSNFSIAMILVLFAYGGWNEIAYVAAEVRDPRRNLLRALVLGVVAVAAIYMLGTAACLHALGHFNYGNAGVAAIMKERFHDAGARFISLLICISALGAVSGMIFTGSRIFYAVGMDYQPLRFLGRLGRTIEAPIPSLVMQAAVTVALLLGFGFYANGFERLIIFTAPAFYLFFALAGIALIVLRDREPERMLPFRVPFYPVTPVLFIAFTLFMLQASTRYAIEHRTWEAIWTLVVSVAGGAICFLGWRKKEPRGFPVRITSTGE